jgi:putative MATE family efflux protein
MTDQGRLDTATHPLAAGSVGRLLIKFAIPSIIAMLSGALYNIADQIFIGRGVGILGNAATNVALPLVTVCTSVGLLLGIGGASNYSLHLGRGDKDEAGRIVANAITFSAVGGAVICVAARSMLNQILSAFGATENIMPYAASYTGITSLGMPFLVMTISGGHLIRADGSPKYAMFCGLVGALLNTALDPIFIFALDMGVRGAAIATAIAQVIVFAMSAAALKLKKDRPFEHFVFFRRASIRLVSSILRWSAPIVVESVLFTFFTMFISRFVAEFGASAIAVYRVGSQIESLCWLIGIGFATAVTAFVGQNYGAGRWDRIRGGLRAAVVFAAIWGALVMLLMTTVGGALFGFFLPDPALMDMGVVFLRILALCQIFGSLESIASGAFRGFGITLPPSFVSVTSNALRVPLAYVLSRSGMGLDGIWIGVTIGASFRGLWVFLWFLKELRSRPKRHSEAL